MYADDLCVLVTGKQLAGTLGDNLELKKVFGNFSGILLNIAKSGVVMKGYGRIRSGGG